MSVCFYLCLLSFFIIFIILRLSELELLLLEIKLFYLFSGRPDEGRKKMNLPLCSGAVSMMVALLSVLSSPAVSPNSMSPRCRIAANIL